MRRSCHGSQCRHHRLPAAPPPSPSCYGCARRRWRARLTVAPLSNLSWTKPPRPLQGGVLEAARSISKGQDPVFQPAGVNSADTCQKGRPRTARPRRRPVPRAISRLTRRAAASRGKKLDLQLASQRGKTSAQIARPAGHAAHLGVSGGSAIRVRFLPTDLGAAVGTRRFNTGPSSACSRLSLTKAAPDAPDAISLSMAEKR